MRPIRKFSYNGEMKTLVAGTQAIGEILEKRSRFITRIAPLGTENPEEQARQVVNEEKSTYPDARHHCSAFIVATDAGTTQTHTSDDGEPPGTAGAPILETLLGANLVNVVAVVTRYFGGTLLGTGGLVRAYAGATQQALKEAKLAEIVHLPQFWTSVPLEHAGKVEAEIRSRSWTIQNAQ